MFLIIIPTLTTQNGYHYTPCFPTLCFSYFKQCSFSLILYIDSYPILTPITFLAQVCKGVSLAQDCRQIPGSSQHRLHSNIFLTIYQHACAHTHTHTCLLLSNFISLADLEKHWHLLIYKTLSLRLYSILFVLFQ